MEENRRRYLEGGTHGTSKECKYKRQIKYLQSQSQSCYSRALEIEDLRENRK